VPLESGCAPTGTRADAGWNQYVHLDVDIEQR
jgi:hypothetical protein